MVGSVINYDVTIILDFQTVSLLAFVPGIRSPNGLVVGVIDDEVTIILHGKSVWA